LAKRRLCRRAALLAPNAQVCTRFWTGFGRERLMASPSATARSLSSLGVVLIVLRQFTNQLGSVRAEAGERIVDVLHGEHDAEVAEGVHRGVLSAPPSPGRAFGNDAWGALRSRTFNPLADLLGQPDEDALRASDVTEPIRILVRTHPSLDRVPRPTSTQPSPPGRMALGWASVRECPLILGGSALCFDASQARPRTAEVPPSGGQQVDPGG